jgi:hypothetical protein
MTKDSEPNGSKHSLNVKIAVCNNNIMQCRYYLIDNIMFKITRRRQREKGNRTRRRKGV